MYVYRYVNCTHDASRSGQIANNMASPFFVSSRLFCVFVWTFNWKNTRPENLAINKLIGDRPSMRFELLFSR